MEAENQQVNLPEPPPKEKTLYGVPLTKDKLPDSMFKQELCSDEELHFTVFMTHFLSEYLESNLREAIEFPPGIPYSTRMRLHHICDKVGLGSFTRGSKGLNKRILVGVPSLAPEKFAAAKKQRDILIFNALKMYKFKVYDPPEVTIMKEVNKIVDEQLAWRKEGLNFEQSWNKVIAKNNEDLSEYVDHINNKDDKEPIKTPQDGKDWSLSTDEYQLYISGENKEVVNKSENKEEIDAAMIDDPNQKFDCDPKIVDEDEPDEYMEEDQQPIEENFKLSNPADLAFKKFENITLEAFEGRPDQIKNARIVNINEGKVELEWEVPDSNNFPITDYIVSCSEIDSITFEAMFKSNTMSDTNSAIIEDLDANTWYVVDIRARNEKGVCPLESVALGINIPNKPSGSLYCWGCNDQGELTFNDSDISSSKHYIVLETEDGSDIERHKAVAPIKSSVFANTAQDVNSNFCQVSVIVQSTSNKNLISASSSYEYDQDQGEFIYDKETLNSMIVASPYLSSLPQKVIKVGCGSGFSVALTSSGQAYSWGENIFGQLGLENSTLNKNNSGMPILAAKTPTLIEDLVSKDCFVVDIAVGSSHCLALTSKQQVYCWGQGCNTPPHKDHDSLDKLQFNHLGYPREVRRNLINYKPMKVFAGSCYSAVLTTDGKLLTFGAGGSGQLGHLDPENKLFQLLYSPKRVDYFDDYFVEDVSLGVAHSFAIVRTKIKHDSVSEGYEVTGSRMLYSWGDNAKGQCGTKDYAQSLLPRKLEVFNDYEALQVSAGRTHSLFVVRKDNETALYACGEAENGATGLTSTLKGCFSTPIRVKVLDKFRVIEGKTELADIYKIKAGIDTSFAIIEST